MRELGQYLKKERLARNISIDQLSEAILIAPRIINDIESGEFSRYQGDEQYVRMYIKKYANYLGLDGDELGNRYLSLTREISLNDIKEAKKKEEEKKSVRVRSQNTLKKPTVYENKPYVEYIKYLLAFLLVGAIVFFVWFGFIRSANQEDPFTPPITPDVSGDVGQNDSTQDNNNDEGLVDQNKDDENSVQNPVVDTIAYTKRGDFDYLFELNDETEFTFKIEFYNRSWAQLWVNGQVYSGFKSKIYNNNNASTPEVVEFTFKVNEFNDLQLNNGYNKGTRYYINGQELVLSDQEQKPGSVKFKLALKKG